MTRRERNDPPRPVNSYDLRAEFRGGSLDGQLARPGHLRPLLGPDGTAGGVDRDLPHYRLGPRRIYQFITPTTTTMEP